MGERKLRLLVIDSDANRSAEEEAVIAKRRLGLDVMAVRSVAAATSLAGASSFEAVLSGLAPPGGSISEVIAAVAPAPVVVVIDPGQEELAAGPMAAGAAGHLVRDPDRRFLDLLPAVIAKAVEHSRTRCDLDELTEQFREAVEQRTAILRAEIADRRRAEIEKALILDSTRDLVVYHDLDMKVLWANRQAGRSVGLATDSLVGRYCWEIWHQRKEACEGCPVLLARDTGRPQQAEIQSPDGRHWSIRGYPVVDADGEIIGLAEFCLDISEAKRTEEALRRSEHRHALALEVANAGSWEWEIDTGKVYRSEQVEPLLGFEPGQLGATLEDYIGHVHADDRHRVIETIESCIRSGDEYTIEHRFVRPDGAVQWISGTGSIVRDDTGQAVRILGIIRDITERRESQNAVLRHRERLEALVKTNTAELHNTTRDLEAARRTIQLAETTSRGLAASSRHAGDALQALLRDHAGVLGGEGRALLETAASCSQEMTRLVDELLALVGSDYP